MKSPLALLLSLLAFLQLACQPEKQPAAVPADPADWTITKEADSLVRDSLLPYTAIIEGKDENVSWQIRTPEQKHAFERIMGLCRRHQLWELYGSLTQSYLGVHSNAGDYLEVFIKWQQVRDTMEAVLPPDNPSLLISQYVVAVALYESGLTEPAKRAFQPYFTTVDSLLVRGNPVAANMLFTRFLGECNLYAFERDSVRFHAIIREFRAATEKYAAGYLPFAEHFILQNLSNEALLWNQALQAKAYALRGIEWFSTMPQAFQGVARGDVPNLYYNLAEANIQLQQFKEAVANLEKFTSDPAFMRELSLEYQLDWLSALALASARAGQTAKAEGAAQSAFGLISSEPATLLQPPYELRVPYSLPLLNSLSRFLQILEPAARRGLSADSIGAMRQLCDLSIRITDSLRRTTFTDLPNSETLTDSAWNVFNMAIDLSNNCLRAEPQDPDRLFRLMDQARAGWLLNSLVNAQGQHIWKVDSSLTTALTIVRQMKANAANNLLAQELNYQSPPTKEQLADIQFLQHKEDSMSQLLGKRHPVFFQLLTEAPVAGIADVQNRILGPQEAWLEFYVSERNVHSVLITPDRYRTFCRVLPPAFDKLLSDVRDMQQPDPPGEQAARRYAQSAYQLYQVLLKDALDTLMTTPGHWYLSVAPQGPLVDLNFGILLTQPVAADQMGIYQRWPYLEFHDRLTLSYEYSASVALYRQAAGKKKASREAAWFGNQRTEVSDFDALSKRLQTTYGGDYLEGSVVNFQTEAPHYQLLHIGAAGKSKSIEEASIFFGQDSGSTGGILTMDELLPLSLSAGLAVVMACESGTGRAHTSEGVLSIGRGFQVAGVSAAVLGQWQVPVSSTGEIVETAYRLMASGMRADEALQQAKRAYLEAHSHDEALPGLWAGMVLQGNAPEEVLLHTKQPWLWWLLALAGISGLAGLLWVFRRRHQSSNF